MNTHPKRMWLLLSVVLATACAAGSPSETPSSEEESDAKTTRRGPMPIEHGDDVLVPEEGPATAAERQNPANQAEPSPRKTLAIAWQRQQTGYWCGPGATRIVISTRESDLPSQSTLAEQLGTTTAGTAWIGLMVKVLNDRWSLNGTSDAFVARAMPDPPSASQRATLKADVVKRIDAGYGIVANIWSGWRPPGYPSGDIQHYVAVIGYDDDGDKVLIADPAAEGAGGTAWANVPRTYWISIQDLGTWIGGKGYAG